jgi:hypothetical protein
VRTILENTDVKVWRHVASENNPADLASHGCDAKTLKARHMWFTGAKWLAREDDWTPFVRLSKAKGDLTTEELEYAELLWIRNIQSSHFADGVDYLERKRAGQTALGKCPAIVRQLNLTFYENGLLRGVGRLSNANVNWPVLLPRKSLFTRLVIQRAHERVFHSGIGATVVAVRRNYWVPACRAVVRTMLHSCIICKRVTGSAFLLPPSPDLPGFRVDATNPFKNIGMDFTGHLLVRDRDGKAQKVYICLFTCLGTRCVNLELVEDLTTDSFIQAFRRHCSSYSVPNMCFSDNASTYL